MFADDFDRWQVNSNETVDLSCYPWHGLNDILATTSCETISLPSVWEKKVAEIRKSSEWMLGDKPPMLPHGVRRGGERGDTGTHFKTFSNMMTGEMKEAPIEPTNARSARPSAETGRSMRWCAPQSSAAATAQLAPVFVRGVVIVDTIWYASARRQAPFLAGAELPSAKHSSQQIFWASLSWLSSARQSFNCFPSYSALRSRRQQVDGLP